MSQRPSFRDLYMRLAEGLAERSTCHRLKVGCVITSIDHRYVHGLGYNGQAAGLPNGCDHEGTPCGCLHAEDNAVINCTVPRDTPKLVFVTHLPCVACAKRLINLGGVRTVYYRHDYRIRDSEALLLSAGIDVRRFLAEPTPTGGESVPTGCDETSS